MTLTAQAYDIVAALIVAAPDLGKGFLARVAALNRLALLIRR
jgi:hypothetical protein